ncbi:hypothetical protein SsS58_08153 [Streptomyces scabiei]|uniref:Uncharacterized protein n=1 Tax=Streptomyces scabiei TaxID=1930 RepID=A0A100JXX1_STRSC|nr:hypothetical protein SsS58_08153 [Streptomyces scabiei]
MLEHRMRGSIRALSGCGRRVVRRRGKVAGVRPCPSSLMTALDVSHPSDPGRDRLLARLSDGRPTSIRRVGWSGPRPHGRCGGRAPRGDKAPSRRPSTGHCTADRSVRTRSASLQRTPSFRWPEPSARSCDHSRSVWALTSANRRAAPRRARLPVRSPCVPSSSARSSRATAADLSNSWASACPCRLAPWTSRGPAPGTDGAPVQGAHLHSGRGCAQGRRRDLDVGVHRPRPADRCPCRGTAGPHLGSRCPERTSRSQPVAASAHRRMALVRRRAHQDPEVPAHARPAGALRRCPLAAIRRSGMGSARR